MLEYPSYMSYPNDWQNDVITCDWSLEMMGAYRELIDAIWLNNGEYPLNFSKLSKVFRKKTKKTTEKMWNSIKIKFFIVENDGPQIHHKRVDEERQRLDANRLRSSNGGKKGMAKRWEKDKGLIKKDKYTYTITDTITDTLTKEKEKENILPPPPTAKFFHPDTMPIIHAWLNAINCDIINAREVDMSRIDEYVRNPKYGAEVVRNLLLKELPTRPGSILAKLDFAVADQHHEATKPKKSNGLRPGETRKRTDTPCAECGGKVTMVIDGQTPLCVSCKLVFFRKTLVGKKLKKIKRAISLEK